MHPISPLPFRRLVAVEESVVVAVEVVMMVMVDVRAQMMRMTHHR